MDAGSVFHHRACAEDGAVDFRDLGRVRTRFGWDSKDDDVPESLPVSGRDRVRNSRGLQAFIETFSQIMGCGPFRQTRIYLRPGSVPGDLQAGFAHDRDEDLAVSLRNLPSFVDEAGGHQRTKKVLRAFLWDR